MTDAIERAWLAGFAASSEGWNGEYPETSKAKAWAIERARAYATSAGSRHPVDSDGEGEPKANPT